MAKVEVVNIKCGGCAGKISAELEKLGATDVIVNPADQTVSFEGAPEKEVLKKLDQLGYPAAGSDKEGSKVKKAKSYVTCAVGRWGPKEK